MATNCSAVNHFFDCHPAWCACWPCYRLIAVPYKIWRNAFQGIRDISITVQGNAVSTNPSSSNYSLVDRYRFPLHDTQPVGDAHGVVAGLTPMVHAIPQHTFFPSRSLQLVPG